MEKYNTEETKSFLKTWCETKGEKISDFADHFKSGEDLLKTPAFLLSNIFLRNDKSLGEQLFDHFHGVEVMTQ